jgi:hypothetical protein
MRFVGYAIAASAVGWLALAAQSLARVPDTNLQLHSEQIWSHGIEEDHELAQQTPAPAPAQAPSPPAQAEPSTDDVLPDLSGEEASPDDVSIGEIPAVEVVELTPETARKAVDAYVLVREKYKDAALENYENLQDFVEQDARGKEFDTDLKGFGFADASAWNVAITTVGFAHSNLLDDQTEDIRQQIEEVKVDTEMAEDMRNRMVQALSAMIPSDNNKKIVEDMMKDPIYGEKLKLLETEEE